MPKAKFPSAAPIPHPIATPTPIPAAKSLRSFLSGVSLMESFTSKFGPPHCVSGRTSARTGLERGDDARRDLAQTHRIRSNPPMHPQGLRFTPRDDVEVHVGHGLARRAAV